MDQGQTFRAEPTCPTQPTVSGLHAATVTGRAGKWLFVDSGAQRAQRADSCLLEPETGDLVLVCDALPARASADGVSASMTVPYVLAVLSRAQNTTSTLTLPGGSALSTTDNALTIHAPRIAIDGGESITASAPQIDMYSLKTTVVSQHSHARIGVLDAGIGRLTLTAKSFVSNVGRLIQRIKDSARWIEGTDELRAGSASWRIQGHAHMHTRHTTLRSDEITRVDGSKIELG